MNAGDIVVRLQADLRNFSGNMTKASTMVKGFSATATKSLTTATNAIGKLASSMRRMVPIGGLGATGIGALIIKTGAAAEEAENLFDVSFGNMAASVRAWSEDLAKQLKVSETGLRQTAGNFQLFLSGMDLSADASRKMSTALTELAYDMSSLRNLKFEDSMTKLQAALAGEVEPLRRIGITVNEVTMKLWAQKQGLDDNVKAWTEQQKVIARTGVIAQGLEKDMGDLNRTQGSTTNLLRSIRDQFREMAIDIYGKWKPYVESSLTGLRDWLIANREEIARWAGRMADAAARIVEDLRKVLSFLATEWETDWTQSGKAIEAIMQATADAVGIVMEDALIATGKNLPAWLWKGFQMGKQAQLATMKMWGEKIGNTIAEGIGRGLSILPGGAGERMLAELKEKQDALNKAQAEGQAEGNRLAKVWEDLTKTLAGLADEQQRVREELSLLTPEMKSFIDSVKGAGKTLISPFAELRRQLTAPQDLKDRLPDLKSAWQAAGGDGANATDGAAKQTTLDIARAYARMYDDIDSKTKESFNARRQLLLEEYNEYLAVTKDKAAVDKWYADQQEKLAIEEGQATGGFLVGARAGLAELKREMETFGQLSARIAKEGVQGITDALTDAVFEAKSLTEALQEVLRSLAKMAFQWAAQNLVTAGLNQMFPIPQQAGEAGTGVASATAATELAGLGTAATAAGTAVGGLGTAAGSVAAVGLPGLSTSLGAAMTSVSTAVAPLTTFALPALVNAMTAAATAITTAAAQIAASAAASGIAAPVPAGSAKGNVFGPRGIMAFAKGGIVDKPTLFPFARGIGMMGEKGPEAIMPLERDAGGRLGVLAQGGNSIVAKKLDTLISLTAKRQPIQLQAQIVDHRDVVTKQQMKGRQGEQFVTYHSARNQ